MKRSLLASLLCLAACRSETEDAANAAAQARTAAEAQVRRDLQYLSSDKLEGRGTGQPGGDAAASFIRERFRSIGLEPAGDRGDYFQAVPLVGTETQPESSLSFSGAASGITPRYLDDFVLWSEVQDRSVAADGDLVFVGYGVVAPEYQWDDYKGVDVKGKFLLMLVSDPPSPTNDATFFGGKALTYYGRWTYKYEIANRLGAAGVLLVHTTASASYGWEVVRNSWARERPFVKLEPGAPALRAAGWLTQEMSRKLLASVGQDLDRLFEAAAKPDFHPIPLGVTVSSRVTQKVREIHTQNVVGRMLGSDPKLRDEAVVICAHYDHLGIGVPVDGDAIYNGCVDNASGVSAMLHAAEALAKSPTKPRRSIIFLAPTAEEGGLRGSEYFARHPPIPAERIACVVNMDSVSVHGRTRDFTFMGAERSTLHETTDAVAREFGIRVVPDEHPEQGSYYRSDHFSLARVGVPGVSLHPGSEYESLSLEDGKKVFTEFNEKHYHRPSDQYDPAFDMSGIVQVADIALEIATRVARADALPEWNAGDEFASVRAAAKAKQ
ncbi:MAG: M20/M25/M40 family metallo-hydrolase [Planctomycetes bacterium]|nr:M20/M25/M40 family metallo-hydrolase [Planctomycetota bacterium]MBI3847764.1 M20/M25/M40 family metallo-hydrolase [Planctomycetota bacterium]